MEIAEVNKLSSIETLESMLRTLKMYHTAENIDNIIEKAWEKSLTNEKFLEGFLLSVLKKQPGILSIFQTHS